MINQIAPTSIGQTAYSVLSSDQKATVMGKSSRGIFVKTSGRWIIFISFESFRGPLTITLPSKSLINQSAINFSQQIRTITPQMPVIVQSHQLIIPDASLGIAIQEENCWHPPAPPANFPNKTSEKKLIILANLAIAKENGAGITAHLPLFLPMRTQITHTPSFNESDMITLQKGVKAHDVSVVIKVIKKIIGVGKGLTPLGDDLTIGLLLSLNRQKEALWPNNSLLDLNQQIIKEAYNKTTTISANLIESAARGQADERLITTLDWVCQQDSDFDSPPTRLFAWGNSSGFAAFTGMAIATAV